MPLVTTDSIEAKNPPISEKTLNHFLSFCERRKFPKNGIIFREGEQSNNLYFILDGSVAVTCADDDGQEMILA